MATNFAFYLKYRPQILDDLIGQEVVKKTLFSSFLNKKLSHAYLFVGPRGTGKTSTARILAKMVNCEKSSVYSLPSTAKLNLATAEAGSRKSEDFKIPCNKCATCLSITDGSNLDLIEIDAASNRGIEDIRSLRDKIKLSPTSSRKKVYIIDEVHMLTPEAFNALLKTLEEPPAHALFILATTEGNKVPQTIISRVQRLEFKLANETQILEALRKIVAGEKIGIDEEALKLIAKKADGSFRDGVKLLDQIASIGEKITVEFLNENLKDSRFENILDLIKHFKNKNASEGLLNVGKQIENGVDIKQLLLSLMEILRNLVFIKNGVGEQLVKGLTDDRYQQLETLSREFSNKDLSGYLNILQSALEKLKFTSISSLPLELAVVEICTPSAVSPDTSSATLTSSSVILSERSESKDITPDIYSSSKTPQNDKLQTKESIHVTSHPLSDSGSSDISKLKEKWTFVLETIRSFNFSLEALLRSININECTQTAIILEVPYSFHQRILESPKNRDLLEGIFSDILGRSIRISTKLGARSVKKEDIVNIEVAGDDEIIKAAAEIFNSDTVN